MYTLYSLLALMLIVAFCLLFLPIFSTDTRSDSNDFIFSKIIIFSIFSIFSFSLYFFLNNTTMLAQWINHGQQHYQLSVDYNQLGGIDGIIAKIKERLAQNPADQQGRIILEKLYRLKHQNQ